MRVKAMRDARDSMCPVRAKLSSLTGGGVVLVCGTAVSSPFLKNKYQFGDSARGKSNNRLD